jgi:predicted O-methyltransferase YrrM
MIRQPKRIKADDPEFYKLVKRLGYAGVIWAGLSFVGWFLVGQIVLLFSVITLGGALVTLQMYLFNKAQTDNFHHYREIEALFSLHNTVQIIQPLPPTRLWAASPDFLTIIAAQIQHHQPKVVLELGSGVSTLISSYLLKAANRGELFTLEHEAHFASKSLEQLEVHCLHEYATIIHAPLVTTTLKGETWRWYDPAKIPDMGKVDLLVIDGPPKRVQKLARYPALPILFERLAQGAIIIVDDFARPDEYEMVKQWMADYMLKVVEIHDNEKGAIVLQKC